MAVFVAPRNGLYRIIDERTNKAAKRPDGTMYDGGGFMLRRDAVYRAKAINAGSAPKDTRPQAVKRAFKLLSKQQAQKPQWETCPSLCERSEQSIES